MDDRTSFPHVLHVSYTARFWNLPHTGIEGRLIIKCFLVYLNFSFSKLSEMFLRCMWVFPAPSSWNLAGNHESLARIGEVRFIPGALHLPPWTSPVLTLSFSTGIAPPTHPPLSSQVHSIQQCLCFCHFIYIISSLSNFMIPEPIFYVSLECLVIFCDFHAK